MKVQFSADDLKENRKSSAFRSTKHIEDIDVGTAPKKLVYREDNIRLYHYSQKNIITCLTPVLIVFALVNRQYMLDLQPDKSLVRKLLQKGHDVFIIDWGYPTRADMYLTMDDYINGYFNNCVDFVRNYSSNDSINLMGICQGGTFSSIYATLYPGKICNLITLVAPFDFSTNNSLLFSWAKKVDIDILVDCHGNIPGDFLNDCFLMLMPFHLKIKKYLDLLKLVEEDDKLINFMRMEKWIFDSPSQAGECLRQFIKDLYQQNKLIRNELRVGGKDVNLKNLTMPLLNVFASADHLVPPDATKALNDHVGSKDTTLYEFHGGHIGVFVGGKSQNILTPAISAWLHERDSGNVGNQESNKDNSKSTSQVRA